MTSPEGNNGCIERRWVAALHEAGHALASFAFARRPGSAQLEPLGGGHADDLSHLPHFAQGIALASGRAAEILAQRNPPPTLTIEGKLRWELKRAVAHLDAAREGDTRRVFPAHTDSMQLGVWSVECDPDYPERWPARVAWARAQATAFVMDNAGAIVALATRLFQQGQIGPEDFGALGLSVGSSLSQPSASPAEV